jgi:hypothetical protein
MAGIDTFLWLVVAFADGSDCLLQGSFQRVPAGQVFMREDGCSVHSQQEGAHVVFWSHHRWVAIKIPVGAKSLSYRWGRAVAHINGDSVTVQYGNIMGAAQRGPSMNGQDQQDPLQKWRAGDALVHRRIRDRHMRL